MTWHTMVLSILFNSSLEFYSPNKANNIFSDYIEFDERNFSPIFATNPYYVRDFYILMD